MIARDPSVRLLGLAAGTVVLCESLAFHAGALDAYAATGSAIAVSAVMTCAAVAETTGSLAGGVLADRHDRRRVGTWSILLAAAALAPLAFGLPLGGLVVLLVAATLVASPLTPVVGASLPSLAAGDDLATANGYVQAVRNAALALAPPLAGLGAGTVGSTPTFAVCAGLLVLAALVLRRIRGDLGRGATAAEAATDGADRSPLAGLRVVRGDRVLRALVIAGTVGWLASACAYVADLPYAIEELGIGQVGYGLLAAAWGIGMTGGALLAGRAMRTRDPLRVFAAGTCASALGLGLAAVAPLPALAVVVFVAGGLGSGAAAAADHLIVQLRAPDGVRGRVRAANDAITSIAYTASLAAGGLIVELLGPRGTYAAGAAGVLASGALVAVAVRRGAAVHAPGGAAAA